MEPEALSPHTQDPTGFALARQLRAFREAGRNHRGHLHEVAALNNDPEVLGLRA